MRAPRDPDVRQLRRHVGALRRQLWLERALQLGARALVLGFGAAVVALVVAWGTLTPIDPTYYGGPVTAALGLALVLSLFRYPSSMEAAKAADHRLGLRERIGTAVELAAGDRGRLQGPIARRQLATALDAAGWAREHWRGGPRVGRELGAAAALGLLAAGLVLLTGLEDRLPAPIPRPSLWSLLPRQDPAPEPVLPDDAPPRPLLERAATADRSGRTADVTRALDELRRGRESGGIGAREAADRLGQAEAELGRQTSASRGQREAIDRLGRALDQIAAGRPAAEAIQRGEYERAGEEVAKLGAESDQLSAQAKAQLAQAMRSAAAESSATPDLAAREQRAADAMAGRDYEAARRAMEDLGQEVSRRGREVVPQQELARAWDQVDQERRDQGLGESAERQGANAQRQGGSEGGRQSPQSGRGQSGNAQGSGAGAGPGTGSGSGGEEHHEDGSLGEGDGSGEGGRAPGSSPGEQTIGTFQPAGQAARLDVQGRPVEVEVRPGQRSGQRPGDSESENPNRQESDEVGAVSAVSAESPRSITSAAPAESNFVPSDRRQAVRDYFTPPGEGEPR